ncbi:MAG: hypothetical protein RLZZ258_165 [Actinomycetota bacterium]|jgi:hypothetical protein
MKNLVANALKPEPALAKLLLKLLIVNLSFFPVYLALIIAIALPLIIVAAFAEIYLSVHLLVVSFIARGKGVKAGIIKPASFIQGFLFATGAFVILAPVVAATLLNLTPEDYEEAPLLSVEETAVMRNITEELNLLVVAANDASLTPEQVAEAASKGYSLTTDSTREPIVAQVQRETAETKSKITFEFSPGGHACLSIANKGAKVWNQTLVEVEKLSELDTFGEYVQKYCDELEQ